MKTLTKVSILGIGTELTTGQILNRNAQWISRQMSALGFETTTHLVVPDDKALMLESWDFCLKHSDLVFVTGGLGPTTDDFTRDIISEATGKSLAFDEESWKHIQERLQSRGVPVREAQKQQCYFPEGSVILKNRMGTANAFSMDYQQKKIFVLPGPPKEIESVWNDHIASVVKDLSKHIDQKKILIWNNLGLGESEISHLTENALIGCNYEKGYRAHHPYVEVKISFKASESKEAKVWEDKITQVLKPYTVSRDDLDIAQLLCQSLEKYSTGNLKIALVDGVSGFHLLNRFVPHLKNLLTEKRFQYFTEDISTIQADVILKLERISSEKVEASITYKNQTRRDVLQSPYKGLLVSEREALYYGERALFFWNGQLD